MWCAALHREYTSAYATELLITAGEVRITNPNKPLFHGFINRNDFAPYPKNPNLRKFFTAFGWTEEIGSGVRNTSRYLPLYSDGALPSFEEKEIFVTRLPLRHYTFGLYALKLSQWLALPVDASEHLTKSLAEMDMPERLHDASFEDVLLDLVPSWVEKGTQLLPKKIWYVVAFLSLCGQPTSFGQLMEFFQYKNRSTFRENYLNPLKKLGFLSQTKPETPNASDNKYVITEMGRAFLLGENGYEPLAGAD